MHKSIWYLLHIGWIYAMGLGENKDVLCGWSWGTGLGTGLCGGCHDMAKRHS